ncbi:1720_t:CDS:2 [Entrophospora sp. SA101]|nr:1720_t:CDS:2 [Entrophospora sp. SA101]
MSSQLPNGNNFLTNEYVHIEDENVWTGLTDEDIIEMVNQKEEIKIEIISNTVAKESVDTVLKYLYQQEPEFGEVKFK